MPPDSQTQHHVWLAVPLQCTGLYSPYICLTDIGNTLARAHEWAMAERCYTDAIGVRATEAQEELRGTILSNRAQMRLKLKRYKVLTTTHCPALPLPLRPSLTAASTANYFNRNNCQPLPIPTAASHYRRCGECTKLFLWNVESFAVSLSSCLVGSHRGRHRGDCSVERCHI